MFDKARTEAFSDGVMAIAITLLVLDLSVPARDALHGNLWAALGHEWPQFLAYAVSFLTIGIMWLNHHALLAEIRQVDRWVQCANLVLLMVVVVIPFPTRLLAEYLTSPGAASRTAAIVYATTNLAMAVTFTALFLAVNHVARATGGPAAVRSRSTLVRFGLGIVVYGATIGVAALSAVASLAIAGVMAVYYGFDQLSRPDEVTAGLEERR